MPGTERDPPKWPVWCKIARKTIDRVRGPIQSERIMLSPGHKSGHESGHDGDG